MEIKPITQNLGAEIRGIDLTSMDAEAHTTIEEAFSRYLVLCFREQKLEPGDIARVDILECNGNVAHVLQRDKRSQVSLP